MPTTYDDNNWLNPTWQDDPSTRWVQPNAPVTVNVDAGMGGGGASVPEQYINARVRDQLRAQGYNVPEPRPAAAPSTGGMPVARIGPDGKPLPGTMPSSGNPAWQAMFAQQQATPARGNALQPASLDQALGWLSALQQHNPSFLDTLMRWLGLRQQQYGPGDGFMAGGGGPRYVLGGGPTTPQARPLTYDTGTPAAAPITPAQARAASAAYASRPAAARSASPGWFVPTNPALNQGGAWVSPKGGQPWLDTAPPAMPYSDWQQS